MTCVSSLRPLNDNAEVAHNQLRAYRSWLDVFDKIVYVGAREPQMDRATFVESPDFPRIKTVALVAALAGEPACIVNADIVLAPHIKNTLQNVMARNGEAAVSRRHEFTGEHWENGALVQGDWGIDFFFALPRIWWQLARVMPERYRIGHNSWDTYVMSFFNTVAGRTTWDITRSHCVFHPRHNERKRVYSFQPVDDIYTLRPGLPRQRL